MIKKIRKVLIAIGTFLISIPTKIRAVIDITEIGNEKLYGVPNPKLTILSGLLNLFRYIILPIVLIIGIVVYIKKSKSSKKRKILTILAIVAIAVAIFFLLTHFINTI